MTSRAETVWEGGRFDAREGPAKVLFGRMYEDAAIELGAFRPGGRIFTIASAGCTAMALSRHHEVVAVDINPIQLAYARRRFGGDPGGPGLAERVMAWGRTAFSFVGWRPPCLRAFLDLEEPKAQIAFWRRHLDTPAFRALWGALFSMAALRTVYASPFLSFLPKHWGTVLRRRMERTFSRHPNRANPYAERLLLGTSPDEPSAREETATQFVCADAASYLEGQGPGSFDGFSLSNILDGADRAYEGRLFEAVRRTARPGAVVVLRSFREPEVMLRTNHADWDRSMLWGVVDVRPAADLPRDPELHHHGRLSLRMN